MKLSTKIVAPSMLLLASTVFSPAHADRGVVSALHVGNVNKCGSFLLTNDQVSPPTVQGYSIQLIDLLTNEADPIAQAQWNLIVSNVGKTVGLTPLGTSTCGFAGGPNFRRLNMPPAADQ